MEPTSSPSSTTVAADAFTPLKPRQLRRPRRPGCLTALGGPLLGLGVWLIAVATVVRPEPETARMLVIAGGVLAVLGLSVLIRRMRTTFGATLRPLELALAEGYRLTPGANVPLRLSQQGPARLARLKIAVVCERRYARQVPAPGVTSVSSVDEVETVWTQDLLDEADVSLGSRDHVVRVVTLAVPPLAKPSGPTLPGGIIAWYLDVSTETGRGAPMHDQFDLAVALSDAPTSAAQPDDQGADRAAAGGSALLTDLGEGVGCALISLTFLLVGLLLLYFYFGGAVTMRGNPVMGLIAGIVFSALGLLGIYGLVSMRSRR